MGFLSNKPKQADMMKTMDSEPPTDLPPLPKKFDSELFQAIFNRLEDIDSAISELRETMINNQSAIYNKLQEITAPQKEVPVLNDEELKFVPEEDKDLYLEMKQTNPKLAETLLKGYKVKSK